MASGGGRGVIAASCGSITCMVLFFVLGVPMIIAALVLFAVANGNYDNLYTDELENCRDAEDYHSDEWDVWSTWSSWSSWYSDDYCDTREQEWEDYKQVKRNSRIAAIVLLIVAILFLVSGLIMTLLMCSKMCKPKGGVVHQQPGQYPMVQVCTVTNTGVTNPGYSQPVVSGFHPPQAAQFGPTQPPAYSHGYPEQQTRAPYPSETAPIGGDAQSDLPTYEQLNKMESEHGYEQLQTSASAPPAQ